MKIDVAHVAKLANLPLKPEEEKKFEQQLSEILSYVEKLREIDSPRFAGEAGTKNVEATSQVTGLENVIREDKVSLCLSQQETLSNAKSQHNGLFRVKAILTE